MSVQLFQAHLESLGFYACAQNPTRWRQRSVRTSALDVRAVIRAALERWPGGACAVAPRPGAVGSLASFGGSVAPAHGITGSRAGGRADCSCDGEVRHNDHKYASTDYPDGDLDQKQRAGLTRASGPRQTRYKGRSLTGPMLLVATASRGGATRPACQPQLTSTAVR